MTDAWQGLSFDDAEVGGLRVRRARQADWPQVLEMVLHPATLAAVDDTAEEAELLLRQVWAEPPDSNLRHFLAESVDGQLLAYFRLEYPLVEDECLWLSFLVIHPDQRGEGWGRQLMALLTDRARQSGVPRKFGMHTLASNVPAARLYEGSGFTCVRREPWPGRDGSPGERLTFSLALQPHHQPQDRDAFEPKD